MTIAAIEPAQRTAAKVAGALYLAVLANSLLAEFFLRAPLLVRGDGVRKRYVVGALAASSIFALPEVTAGFRLLIGGLR